jgi:SNF2 family DNA or RNA helicase
LGHGVEGAEALSSASKATPFYWNVYSQLIQRNPPPKHTACQGGILADDMGLGKTVMAVGLILSDFKEKAEDSPHRQSNEEHRSLASSNREESREMNVELGDSNEDDAWYIEMSGGDSDFQVGDGAAEKGSNVVRKGSKKRGNYSASSRSSRSTSGSCSGKKRRMAKIIHSDDEEEDKAESRPSRLDGALNQTCNITFQPQSPLPPSKDGRGAGTGLFRSTREPCQTLVVAPMTLISQWTEEVITKTKEGSVRVHMYYGDKGERSVSRLSEAQVVVTSYGVLTSEMRSWVALQDQSPATSSKVATITAQLALAVNDVERERSRNALRGLRPGLLSVHWHRVILDEAHVIKNSHTEAAKACCMLHSRKRWCLTGTPLQNTVDDIYSLVKFLQHEPWAEYRFFRKVISDPCNSEKRDKEDSAGSVTGLGTTASGTTPASAPAEASEGMVVLRRLLSEILLRRTKTMKDKGGDPIVKLPPRHVHVQMVDMVPEEREFYDSILRRSRAVFSRYEDMANNRAVETGDAAYSSSSDALTEEQEEAELRLALQRMSQGDKKYALRNRYTALFTLLLRMRMACDHPWLVIQGGRKAKDSNVIQGDSAHASPQWAWLLRRAGVRQRLRG